MIKLTKLFSEFYNSEKAGGLVLVFVTLFSLVFQECSGLLNMFYGAFSVEVSVSLPVESHHCFCSIDSRYHHPHTVEA